MSKKTVVVVGGGFAGTKIARALSLSLSPDLFNIILIDPRPYHIILPATIRMVVSDSEALEKTALVPYDKLFVNGNGQVVQGKVHRVHQTAGAKPGCVSLEDGERIAYDALVISTGSSWMGHIAFPFGDVESWVKTQRSWFTKAQNILLIGAGPVGLETAGEIRDMWPEKEVTIVHNTSLPLNESYPDKFRLAAAESFRARKINLIFDDMILDPPSEIFEPTTITTRNGVKLFCDLIVNTTGIRPLTTCLQVLSPTPLNAVGFVNIKPTFQLKDYPNIFAAGDVINWRENKQALKTNFHAPIVSKNVKLYLEGSCEKRMSRYRRSFEAIFLTNGRNGGLIYIPMLPGRGIVLGDCATRLMKSRNLMIPMLREMVGY